MNNVQWSELVSNLVEFVARASSEEAKPEEIAILPAVVKILIKIASSRAS